MNYSRPPRGNVFPTLTGLVFILQFNPKTSMPIGHFVSEGGCYDLTFKQSGRANIWKLEQAVNGGRIPT